MSWEDEIKKSPAIKRVSEVLKTTLRDIKKQEKNLLYMIDELGIYSSADRIKEELVENIKKDLTQDLKKLQIMFEEMQGIEEDLMTLMR